MGFFSGSATRIASTVRIVAVFMMSLPVSASPIIDIVVLASRCSISTSRRHVAADEAREVKPERPSSA